MKRDPQAILYHKDKLVARWYNPVTRQYFMQGLRVGKSCPLTKSERAIYTHEGLISVVKTIYNSRKLSLSDSLALLNSARNAYCLAIGIKH